MTRDEVRVYLMLKYLPATVAELVSYMPAKVMVIYWNLIKKRYPMLFKVTPIQYKSMVTDSFLDAMVEYYMETKIELTS